jgi:hypothetical protein
MGMLARMAQATFLLGRVLRLQSPESASEDAETRKVEVWQLDATLRALLNLAYVEGSLFLGPVCAQTSICYRYVQCTRVTTAAKTSFQVVSSFYMIRPQFGRIQTTSSLPWTSSSPLLTTCLGPQESCSRIA